MRLQRLTSLEVQKIMNELEELRALILDLKDILAKPERIQAIVCKELQEVSEKHGDPRCTEIRLESIESSSFQAEDLIADEDMIVQLSEDMFIKRLPLDTFRRQRRGGKGIQGASTKRDDFIKKLATARTHDNLMLFSNKGKAYSLKVYELPLASREARGKSLKAIIGLSDDELITSMFSYRDLEDTTLLMVTEKGFVKKCLLSQFSNAKKSGIIALGLRDDDKLIDVVSIQPEEDVFLGSKNGLAVRMNLGDLKPQGRTASGVTGMRLAENDLIAGVAIVREGTSLFVISENGYGKRTDFSEFATKGRGGRGMAYLKIGEKNGRAVGIASVREKDEILVITQSGMTIRTAAGDISKYGRTAIGVRVVNTKDQDMVVDFAILSESEEE